MFFYLIQVFIFLCYSAFFYAIRPNFKRTYYVLSTIHFSLIMGLRSYWIGTDTSQYVGIYLQRLSDFNQGGGLVYNWISNLIWTLTNGNYHIFLLVLSTLTVSLYILFVYLIKSNYYEGFLSIYIYITFYYYFNAFNIQRQMLAVSISLIATYLCMKNKWLWGLILLLVAVGIHSTAVVCIVNLIILKVKKSRVILLTSILLSGVLILRTGSLLNKFAGIFGHYAMYLNTFNSNELASKGGTIILGLFIMLFIALTCLINKDVFKDNKFGNILFLSAMGSIIYIVGYKLQLLIRMADYFAIYSTVFLPYSIESFTVKFSDRKLAKIILTAIVMLAGFILLYYKLSKNMGDIIPYSFGN